LPVESGVIFVLVTESGPLQRSEILDDHSRASPFGPKSDGAPRLNSFILNFFLMPSKRM
jgi:hypothetical protein